LHHTKQRSDLRDDPEPIYMLPGDGHEGLPALQVVLRKSVNCNGWKSQHHFVTKRIHCEQALAQEWRQNQVC